STASFRLARLGPVRQRCPRSSADPLRPDAVEYTPQVLRSLYALSIRHQLDEMALLDAGHAECDLRLTPGRRGAQEDIGCHLHESERVQAVGDLHPDDELGGDDLAYVCRNARPRMALPRVQLAPNE